MVWLFWMIKTMKQLTRKQVILIGIILLLFASLKILTIWYWQKTKTSTEPMVPFSTQCDIRQSCTLPNGVALRFAGTINSKTPFSIVAKNVPVDAKDVHISFSMKDMDMGFNRFKLLPKEGTTWAIEKVRLPVCILDSKEYIAQISIGQDNYEIPFVTD